jgi:hypothetical protein
MDATSESAGTWSRYSPSSTANAKNGGTIHIHLYTSVAWCLTALKDNSTSASNYFNCIVSRTLDWGQLWWAVPNRKPSSLTSTETVAPSKTPCLQNRGRMG